MGRIEHRDFSAGLCPSDDFLNGRPNGLQRMDNVNLDQNGALTLVRIPLSIHSFPDRGATPNLLPFYCYSKIINGVLHRYAVLSDGSIWKDVDKANTFPTSICAARTGYITPAFGSGLGQVYIFNSTPAIFLKDDGTTVRAWGINAPASFPALTVNPGVTSWAGANVVFYTNFTSIEGSGIAKTSTTVQITTDATTFRAIVQSVHDEQYTRPSDGSNSTDNDEFNLQVKIADSAALQSITFEFLLKTPSGSAGDVSDYYWYTWNSYDPAHYFRSGINFWTTLRAKRSQFQREGADNTLNWGTVKAIRIIFNATAVGTYTALAPHQFIGSENYPLYAGAGDVPTPYQYVQVNVYQSGAYTGSSAPSVATLPTTVLNGSVTITPYVTGIDGQVNKIWIYKRGGTLDQYYFVGSCAPGGTVTDNHPDSYYLEQNLKLNTFLAKVSSITDRLIGIDGPINGRMALLTQSNLYVTDYLNPEAYDLRTVITLSGNVGEVNLFIARIGNAQLIVGTTQDIYEISGSFVQLPDGSFDVQVRSLGIRQPPISDAFAISSNGLYYLANDGVRVLLGMTSQVISGELSALWRGEGTPNIPPFNIQAGNVVPYKLVIAKNRIVLLMYHKTASTPPGWDGTTAAIYEFDLEKNIWFRRALTPLIFPLPVMLFTEEDGTIIMCGFDGNLWQYDAVAGQDSIFIGSKLLFNFQTIAFDGGEPNSRKDLFTLKLSMCTYGQAVDVYLVSGAGGVAFLGSYTTPVLSLNTTDVLINLSNTPINTSKRISLLIQNNTTGNSFFRFTGWSVDYKARPPQELSVVEYPNNLGVDGRKAIYRLGIMIDTLGGFVDIVPTIDGVSHRVETFQSVGKGTFSYVFEEGVTGYDVSLSIHSRDNVTPFEYYGLSLADCIIEKIPAPANFLVIPPNNFGTPSLKRFRTLPFVINTLGNDVSFQPIIDGQLVDRAVVFNTTYKKTLYYYFVADAIGVDYGGVLKALLPTDSPRLNVATKGLFEFYGFLSPVTVETLPTPKLRDQIGPMQFDRIGRVFELRVRMMARTPTINYNIIMDNGFTESGSFITTPNLDTVYTIKLDRKVMGTVCRIEFTAPTSEQGDSFYRWACQVRVRLTGMQTELKWMDVK